MRIVTLLLLLMTVVCTYARSFSDIDIPDPPLNQIDDTDKIISVKEYWLEKEKSEADATNATVETTTKLQTSPNATSSPNPTTSPMPTSSSPKPPSTPTLGTTTLDPWAEFCKEACEEGLAGPECDCPEHPIGRRSVDSRRHRRSTDAETSDTDDKFSFKHYNSKAKPTVNLKVKRLLMKYCKLVCDYGIQDDICRCSAPSINPGCTEGNSTQKPSAEGTTKDPLEEFCETACSEGQGTLACNCHDHIIGRRRRSLGKILPYPIKSSLKTLNSKSNTHHEYKRSLGEYQDTTLLENALPRVTLNRDSVQSQDLSVNFPFRTLPEKINAPREKFTRVKLFKDSTHKQDLKVNFPYAKMTEQNQK